MLTLSSVSRIRRGPFSIATSHRSSPFCATGGLPSQITETERTPRTSFCRRPTKTSSLLSITRPPHPSVLLNKGVTPRARSKGPPGAPSVVP